MQPSPNGTFPRAGDPVDLAPFACVRWWTGTEKQDLRAHDLQPDRAGLLRPAHDRESGDWQIGLEWQVPHDVRQVVVRFTQRTGLPPDLRVQYWRKNWPTPAPERRPGARRGWIGQDDPWHGEWTTVRAEQQVAGETCTFTFDPIDLAEIRAAEQLEAAEHYLARFRRTLKLRLLCGGEAQPQVAGLHAYSASCWQEGLVDVHLGLGQAGAADWSGWATATDGYLLSVEPLPSGTAEIVTEGNRWTCPTDNETCEVRLRLLYASCEHESTDRTIVTVYTQARSFSFLVADLDRGPICVPDYDLAAAWAGTDVSLEKLEAQREAMPRPIYDRVSEQPEHSLARAMAEIPPLDVTKQESYGGMGFYMPLGVEAGRQEWALRYNGELFANKVQLKPAGRDLARLLWPGHQIRYRFGTGDPPDFRERRDGTRQSLLDGWLPVVHSRWLDREVEYEQTAFAALLDGPMTPPEARRGDEDIVAMLRFQIHNATPGPRVASIWLAIAPQEEIELRDGAMVARGRVVPASPVARQWRTEPYASPVLRCTADTGGRGRLHAVPFPDKAGSSHAIPTALLYEVELDSGERHAITMAVPFPSLTEEEAWHKVQALDYEDKLDDVVAYWRGYVASGGQIDVPERVLGDFHKAARAHVAISADKDPVSGLIVVPAATYAYGACGNEACWQIQMLDQAGHHDRAETYLETFLATQGTSPLDGDFGSQEGVLQGLDMDAGMPRRGGFSYNLDIGYIMECLAEHYFLSGDTAWLRRVAANLVAACDFVVRERARTQRNGPDGRPVPEWGLLPAGHLEDNPEWRHWFAVNAHAYNGMQRIAAALAEIDHPEAGRLLAAAADYRADIRRAARRAMVDAPVVHLLDGTYIPRVPTRTSLQGREWGWFREAAYGALHLLEGDVFDPDEEEMTWVLKDLEDNLFPSREWGRPVDLERYWFSHGGVTIQPNLMDLGIDYLRRRQVKHALRALYNNFGVSLYRDVPVFTEHPVIELGHGVGPFFKSSDESKALVWLRAFLIWEEGTALHLAKGAPRAWFAPGQSFGVRAMATHFGALTYQVRADEASVTAEVHVPERRPPETLILYLRCPEGEAIQAVTVDGEPHAEWDPQAETVRIAAPSGTLVVRAHYD
jgi:hypothetical protein